MIVFKNLLCVMACFFVLSISIQDVKSESLEKWSEDAGIRSEIKQFVIQRLNAAQIKHEELNSVRDDVVRFLEDGEDGGGEDLEEDLKNSMEKLLVVNDRRHREMAGAIAGSLYLMTGSLESAYEYSGVTDEPFEIIVEFVNRSSKDDRLSDYIVWSLLRKLMRIEEEFYFKGNVVVYKPVALLKYLTRLPITPVSERFLLNYPFESGAPMMSSVFRLGHHESRVPGSSKNYLEWYLQEIISQTPFEDRFFQQLKKRNLLDWVSGGSN